MKAKTLFFKIAMHSKSFLEGKFTKFVFLLQQNSSTVNMKDNMSLSRRTEIPQIEEI